MGALSLTSRTPDVTRTSVSQVRAGTKGPFLVNYILREEPATLKVALDAGAPIVQFSWGTPTREMVSAIRAAGAKFGMSTMDQHLAELVKKGQITYDAALEKCHHVEDFERLCGRA